VLPAGLEGFDTYASAKRPAFSALQILVVPASLLSWDFGPLPSLQIVLLNIDDDQPLDRSAHPTLCNQIDGLLNREVRVLLPDGANAQCTQPQVVAVGTLLS
jgi:hypothetical protein